jgi:hypothetical protein
VDLPVPVVDVERVLEEDGELDEAGAGREARVEVGEVGLDLRSQALSPPVEEVLGVVRQHPAEVGADTRGILRVARNAWRVPRLELRRLDLKLRVGGDGGGVEVAVDVLGDPVGGEWGPEAAEHVVAREPPAADVEEHRRKRIGAVEVVEDPEELLLPLLPLDREAVVAVERGEDRAPDR